MAWPLSASTEVTGPRLAHRSEVACGAMSHSAPFSFRHGVLNGLDAARDDPIQVTAPAVHPPWLVTSASQARVVAWNRAVKKTTVAACPCSAASTRASASASASAMGFSSSRCLPSCGLP